MPGRDTPRSRDPDDWFAGLEPDGLRRGRTAERPAAAAARASAPEGDDDWLGADARPRLRRESRFAASLSDRRFTVSAGVFVVACLVVAGFVLPGVFSSSKPKSAATTTQTTASQTTTTSTTTQGLATTVPPPTTTLKPGDTGTQVKALQRALAHLGYSVGKVDGTYGPATKKAVARFQTAAKLTADGIFGPATRAALVRALKR